MGSTRQHSRMKFYSFCNLIGQKGDTYRAMLGDISLRGASVLVNCDTHIQVGDVCQIRLNEDSALIPLMRTGRVIWVDSRVMGMALIS